MEAFDDFLVRQLGTYEACYAPFHATFGCNLRKFFDSLTGFDLVKFDDLVVKPADNQSCRDAIVAKWGEAAAKLVERLIGANSES